MIPISLHLENKNVLVVGSGNVALRKIRQYLREKANVTVLTLDTFESDKVVVIQDEYHPKYLKNMFLVYAATNNSEVNHQIVNDCNQRNILCGNAKYDSEANFYSMNSISNDFGTISLSTNQKLPYSKPVLEEMLTILDKKKERLQMIADLRPYIIQKTDRVKEYMVKLYDLEDQYLKFIHDSTLQNKGYIMLYHPGAENEAFEFHLDPCICITHLELEELKQLFIFNTPYQIIPLVLSDGIIYKKMASYCLPEWNIMPPIVHTEEDVKKILSIYHADDQHTVYIMHPRKENILKQVIQKNLDENEIVYDFAEDYKLEKNIKNRVVLFLVTHGRHYQEIKDHITLLGKLGYDVDFLGTLLDNQEIIKWIEEGALNGR